MFGLLKKMSQNIISSSETSSQRGPKTSPAQAKAIISYFEDNLDMFRVYISKKTTSAPSSGTIISKSEVVNRMFEKLGRDGAIPGWTLESIEGRVSRVFAKYKATLRQSRTTGFGLSLLEQNRGITTIEEKLEDLCPGFSRLATLHGERQNTHPYRLAFYGAPGGVEYQYASDYTPGQLVYSSPVEEAISLLRPTPTTPTPTTPAPTTPAPATPAPSSPAIAPYDQQLAAVLNRQAEGQAEMLAILSESRPRPAPVQSSFTTSTGAYDAQTVLVSRGRGRGRAAIPTIARQSVRRPRVDNENPSRNSRLRRDFTSEYRSSQRDRSLIADRASFRDYSLGLVNATLAAINNKTFGDVSIQEAARNVREIQRILVGNHPSLDDDADIFGRGEDDIVEEYEDTDPN